jgi:2-polyprenyl-3-methyl-5-hydroxy-6-metoxy-1,4-benzoquinol methylase
MLDYNNIENNYSIRLIDLLDTFKKDVLRSHLVEEYKGVIQEKNIDDHYRACVNLRYNYETYLKSIFGLVEINKDTKILDVGCGYGTFVLLCRLLGMNACGVDVSNYELSYAKERYGLVGTEEIYLTAEEFAEKYQDEKFNVITFWNVLEHVADQRKILQEYNKFLTCNGKFVILNANYFSFRREPHYSVFWLPLLPKPVGSFYLRLRRKSPIFLNSSIYYATFYGIINSLHNIGKFKIMLPILEKYKDPRIVQDEKTRRILEYVKRTPVLNRIVHIFIRMISYNIFKNAVFVIAEKCE